MLDLHIHSFFSPDSSSKIEDIIQNARHLDLKIIGIADHYDLEERIPYAYRVKNIDEYFKSIDFYSKNTDEIIFLKGLEVGIQSTVDGFEDDRFDYFIYSVHGLPGVEDMSGEIIVENYEKFYEEYFDEMLKALEKFNQAGFLGHLDYPRRYLKGKPEVPESLYRKLNDIFTLLKEKNIGIEINTSNMDRIFFDTLPSYKLIKEYVKATGGKLITIGSDAHSAERVGKFSYKVAEMLKELGVKTVYYCKNGEYQEFMI